MSADPALSLTWDEVAQQIAQLGPDLDKQDRQMLYTVLELSAARHQRGLASQERRADHEKRITEWLESAADLPRVDVQTHPPDGLEVELKYAGPARKVSVSLPEDLLTAVQQRVGRGKFSQYVTDAVARQHKQDLLAELAALLTEEYGPVTEEDLSKARAAWPDQ